MTCLNINIKKIYKLLYSGSYHVISGITEV